MSRRILFLADVDSSHTRKWASSLATRGYEIGIFSLNRSTSDWMKQFPAITVFEAQAYSKDKFRTSDAGKLSYLKMIPVVKKVIAEFKPDVVHAHYATSYGLLGARSKFHPFIISVWGADVFDFPKKGFLNRRMLIHNLKRADRIFSTSNVMKTEILKYVDSKVDVTPFGVDVNTFSPGKSTLVSEAGTKIVGLVKSLEDKYGIDVLIRAFALVSKEYSGKVKLVIAGEGSRRSAYELLARELNIADDVIMPGKIPAAEVAEYHKSFDVFASLSVLDSESFGVSLVEAMACGKPAVVSAVGGLKEVAVDKHTALFVPKNDERATANTILRLLNDEALSRKLGDAGRQRVLELYDWNKNLDHIEQLYAEVLTK